MSNVYKRPMFRRGGSTNMNGIMDGITDRQDYNVRGGAGIASDNIRLSDLAFMKREMPSVPDDVRSAPSIRNDSEPSYEEKVRKIMEDYESKRVNPVYKLLTQGGLRGMSERGGGSVAANLAKAFEGPTDQLFKDLDAKRAMERDIELKIADVAEQKNRRLQEQGFELQKLLTKDMRNTLRQQAINLAEGDPEKRSVDEIFSILVKQKLEQDPDFRKMADPRETRQKNLITMIQSYQKPGTGMGLEYGDASKVASTHLDIMEGKYGEDVQNKLDGGQPFIDRDDVEDVLPDEQGIIYMSKQPGGYKYNTKLYYINPQDGRIYKREGNRFILQRFPTE